MDRSNRTMDNMDQKFTFKNTEIDERLNCIEKMLEEREKIVQMTKDHDENKANQADFLLLKQQLDDDAPTMKQFSDLKEKTMSYIKHTDDDNQKIWKRLISQQNSQYTINTEINKTIDKHGGDIDTHENKLTDLIRNFFKMKN